MNTFIVSTALLLLLVPSSSSSDSSEPTGLRGTISPTYVVTYDNITVRGTVPPTYVVTYDNITDMSEEDKNSTISEDTIDMSEEDKTKVIDWIRAEITMAKNPFCYKDTYGRSVGTIPGRVADCPYSYTNNGLTCGRNSDDILAPSLVADCPVGYTNMG